MKSFNSGRTYGESFIVAVVVAGFFWLISEGKLEVESFWSYAGFLGLIVVFYFALLLCHTIFFHMIGGGVSHPWWEHVEHFNKNLKKTSKK